MATTLTSKVTLRFFSEFVNALDLSNTDDQVDQTESTSLANGTGSGQADVCWHDTRSAAAAVDDLDLAGSLTNAFGSTVTFAAIKAIVIVNNSTTSGEVLSVGAGSNPVTSLWGASGDILKVGPGSSSTNPGFAVLCNPQDGYAVTAGTADILRIDPGANTISYDIWIVGTSA